MRIHIYYIQLFNNLKGYEKIRNTRTIISFVSKLDSIQNGIVA